MKKLLSLLMGGMIIVGAAHTNAFAGGAFSTLKLAGDHACDMATATRNWAESFFLGNGYRSMKRNCSGDDILHRPLPTIKWRTIKSHDDAIKFVVKRQFKVGDIASIDWGLHDFIYEDCDSTEHCVELSYIEPWEAQNYVKAVKSEADGDSKAMKLLLRELGDEAIRIYKLSSNPFDDSEADCYSRAMEPLLGLGDTRSYKSRYELSEDQKRSFCRYFNLSNFCMVLAGKCNALKSKGYDMSRIGFLVVEDWKCDGSEKYLTKHVFIPVTVENGVLSNRLPTIVTK